MLHGHREERRTESRVSDRPCAASHTDGRYALNAGWATAGTIPVLQSWAGDSPERFGDTVNECPRGVTTRIEGEGVTTVEAYVSL